MNNLVISADCPSCGAPLDFTEGSNAITCKSCKSNLLVTGKKQVLSYFVSPNLDAPIAMAKAVMAQRDRGFDGFSNKKAQLYFIPYYRMTGQDLGIEKAPKPAPEQEDGGAEGIGLSDFYTPPDKHGRGELFNIKAAVTITSFDKAFRNGPVVNQGRLDGAAAKIVMFKTTPYDKGEVVLNERYVEKSFLACNLSGLGIYSLGVRPSVLRLELFRPEALKALGKIVDPSLSIEEAEKTGIKTLDDSNLLTRLVIGKVLSIIYFPFWVVEMESRGQCLLTLIDAVSQSVIKADAPIQIYDILNDELKSEPVTVGFRPLTCPNCGWDFPVKEDDTVFFCSSCSKAWRLEGSGLNETGCRIAEWQWPGGGGDPMRYLPFWVFQKKGQDGNPLKFYVPVFRYRRPKLLVDMAVRFTRGQPAYSFEDAQGKDLAGCYYDEEEAGLIAQLTQSIVECRRAEDFKAAGACPMFTDATLTWFPFRVQGEYLMAPFGGPSIPKNLLL